MSRPAGLLCYQPDTGALTPLSRSPGDVSHHEEAPVSLLLLLAALALSALPTATSGEEKKPAYKPFGTIERKDPRFDKLIAPDVKAMEDLADGFDWSEGPVWVNKDGGYLLCSDIPKNQVVKWQEGKGKSVFLQPSGYYGKETYYKEPGSNGLLLDGEGRLDSHAARRTRRRPAGEGRQDSPRSSINTWASGSTAPTTASSSRTATSTSPIRPTA